MAQQTKDGSINTALYVDANMPTYIQFCLDNGHFNSSGQIHKTYEVKQAFMRSLSYTFGQG